MKLQTSKAQKAADKKYIDDGGDLIDLIYSAAEGLAKAAKARYMINEKPVVIFAGSGNNGKDGLAAADLLARDKVMVKVIRPEGFKKPNDSAAAVLEKRLSEQGINVIRADSSFDFETVVKDSSCVLDCLFGTGFDTSREVSEVFKIAVNCVNSHSPCTISADIASGVSADTGECADPSIKASETVTFGAPKPGQFILPGKARTGVLTVSPILIKTGLTDQNAPECFSAADKETVKKIIPKRHPYGNKYTNGRVLVIAGSRQYAGAAILAVSSALRGGAGLVTAAIPGSIAPAVTAACPEAVRLLLGSSRTACPGPKHLNVLLDAAAIADAVVIGPGVGRTPGTVKTVIDFLKKTSCAKIVVDADALFALAVYNGLCGGSDSGTPETTAKYLKLFAKTDLAQSVADLLSGKDAVLTPHTGEAARLLAASSGSVEQRRLAAAKEISGRYRAVTVLKGNDTVICAPSGACTVNNTGNSALSKGGSGDVLAGLAGALLAAGADAYDAARASAFIHGLAAETLSDRMTEYSVLPGDLPLAFSELMC